MEPWERAQASWGDALDMWRRANVSWKGANRATLLALLLSVCNFSWFAWMAFHHGRK